MTTSDAENAKRAKHWLLDRGWGRPHRHVAVHTPKHIFPNLAAYEAYFSKAAREARTEVEGKR